MSLPGVQKPRPWTNLWVSQAERWTPRGCPPVITRRRLLLWESVDNQRDPGTAPEQAIGPFVPNPQALSPLPAPSRTNEEKDRP